MTQGTVVPRAGVKQGSVAELQGQCFDRGKASGTLELQLVQA